MVITLAAVGSAGAQYAYEPSPKGTIPSDLLPYGAAPDTAELHLTPLPAGERVLAVKIV